MKTRDRLFALWMVFLAAAGIAGLAVYRLHRTAQAEIAVQSERAVRQAQVAAEEKIQEAAADVRRAIIVELAGFHEDGLAATLRKWNANSELVTATFQWDTVRGLVVEPAAAGTLPFAEPVTLWTEFRGWRTANPKSVDRVETTSEGVTVGAVRTLDHPAWPAAAFRYQGENLDLQADVTATIDPWAGWAGGREPAWIVWYQTGPESPVRGCVVATRPLVASLERAIAGGELASVVLQPVAEAMPSKWPLETSRLASRESGIPPAPLPELPGYRLLVVPGEIFEQKSADARFDALIAALLLGLFLLGAAALGLRTRREARDAGRKITFVTQVSHELRTPLTSIRMFADMLATPGLPEEKRVKFATTIGAESARLGDLIERLLAFNALESKAGRVRTVPLEPAALVREVVEETSAKLAEAGVKPVLALPTGPYPALGDRSVIKQALINLLDNACKYAAEGGVVEISVGAVANRVVVRVADRGAGIPALVRERLFEPFVQGGQTLTNKSPGVGLGLSLARGLLRQAGADLVLVASERGAAFEIRLPASPSP